MSDEPAPPKSPRRGRGAKSILTGEEYAKIFELLGLTAHQFSQQTGANLTRLKRQLSGADPEIPLWWEAVVLLFYLHPELISRHPLPLPYAEWEIDITEVEE